MFKCNAQDAAHDDVVAPRCRGEWCGGGLAILELSPPESSLAKIFDLFDCSVLKFLGGHQPDICVNGDFLNRVCLINRVYLLLVIQLQLRFEAYPLFEEYPVYSSMSGWCRVGRALQILVESIF